MEDELLCDAWLDVFADFVVRSRGGPSANKCMNRFTMRKQIVPCDMHIIHDRNVRSLSYRWYAIQTSITKFCGAVDILEARWPLRAAA